LHSGVVPSKLTTISIVYDKDAKQKNTALENEGGTHGNHSGLRITDWFVSS